MNWGTKQVLVLLNVVQDQSMKDEGLAREAINLVQKLRKEAHVTPSDAVTVYYEVEISTDLEKSRFNNLNFTDCSSHRLCTRCCQYFFGLH